MTPYEWNQRVAPRPPGGAGGQGGPAGAAFLFHRLLGRHLCEAQDASKGGAEAERIPPPFSRIEESRRDVRRGQTVPRLSGSVPLSRGVSRTGASRPGKPASRGHSRRDAIARAAGKERGL